MKKIFAMALAATMVLSLTACTGGDNSSSSTPEGSSSTDSSVASTSRLEEIKAKGKIIMVTSPDYAPYEFIDLSKMGQGQEQYVGADIEMGRYIAQKLGVELEIQAMDYDAVLTAVNEGKCDMAISGIAPDADRAKTMDFSMVIGSEGYQGVLVKKENLSKFNSIESLNQSGIKIAVQNGSLQQKGRESNFPNATEVIITALSNGVMEVQSGKVDAMVIASGPAEGFMKSYDDLAMADLVLDLGDDGTAIAMPKGKGGDFMEEVNKIVKEVLDEGLYEKWTEESKALADSQAPQQ